MNPISLKQLYKRLRSTIRNYMDDREIYESAIIGIKKYNSIFNTYPDTVIDIGAHIGSVSFYALEHNASNVIAIEADLNNFTQLFKNLFSCKLKKGQVLCCLNRAFDSTTNKYKPLYICVFGNTGQRSIAYNADLLTKGIAQVVQTINLKDIFKENIRDHVIVDYLKIDIEGGEYAALPLTNETEKYLKRVKFIDIEFHPIPKEKNKYFNYEKFMKNFKGAITHTNIIEAYIEFLDKCGFKRDDRISTYSCADEFKNGYKLCVPNQFMMERA